MLGTQDKDFSRLLKTIDKAISTGIIKEKVVVQAGFTKYSSSNMEIFDYVSPSIMDDYIDKASLIITHGGVGSILGAIKKGKKVIAASRLKKYNEHTNDHQVQIVKSFSMEGYILSLDDFDDFALIYEKALHFKPRRFVSNNDKFVKRLDDYILTTNHVSYLNRFINFITFKKK